MTVAAHRDNVIVSIFCIPVTVTLYHVALTIAILEINAELDHPIIKSPVVNVAHEIAVENVVKNSIGLVFVGSACVAD